MSGISNLVINLGSSSVKWGVYSDDCWIVKESLPISTPNKIVEIIFKKCSDLNLNIEKIYHRVVYGKEYSSCMKVNSSLLNELKSNSFIAPLHQQRALEIVELLVKKYKDVNQYLFFDSSFHLTIPEFARTYAIPLSLSVKYNIRKNGFHGLAHQALYNELCSLKKVKKLNKVISCQLGSGVSLCAILNGKSVDTTMGFTPLEGCVMSSRSGSIDPAIVGFLENKLNKSGEEIIDILETKSGLYGLSGDKDMKEVIRKARLGDKKAKLALEVFIHSFKKHLGEMMGVLGGVDAIVIGGGISNSSYMRKELFSGLESLGIKIDRVKSNQNVPVKISSGKVEVFVLEGDEMQLMADFC